MELRLFTNEAGLTVGCQITGPGVHIAIGEQPKCCICGASQASADMEEIHRLLGVFAGKLKEQQGSCHDSKGADYVPKKSGFGWELAKDNPEKE